MIPPPVLTDDALLLRPLVPSDWTALFAVAADPLIWAGHPAHDRWQEAVFRRYFDEALASGGGVIALNRATDHVIGASRFDRTRAGENEVEIGWTFLARDHWGGTWNRRMKRLMLAHALTHVDAVVFLIGEDNIRSRTAIEGIGGALTDRVDVTELAGRPVRHLVYRIDRACFANGPLSRSEG